MDLVALEEIRQVKYRYLRCVDLKLWDEMAEVFTPDATVDYGTMVYGRPLKLTGRDVSRTMGKHIVMYSKSTGILPARINRASRAACPRPCSASCSMCPIRGHRVK